VKFVATKKCLTKIFFSPLSSLPVFGSGIRDPGSGIRDPGSGMGKNQDPGSGIGSEYTRIYYSEVGGGRAVGQAGRFIFYSLLVHNTPTTHQHQALNIQGYTTARWVAAEL
jgi:hypothetical protein